MGDELNRDRKMFDCYLEALIRALRTSRHTQRRMNVAGRDGVWIDLPDGVLERVIKAAQRCHDKDNGNSNGPGDGKPPPILRLTVA